MADDVLVEKAKKAVKSCQWRKEVGDVAICAWRLLPCGRVIARGNCDAIKKIFEEKENEQ